MLAGSGLASQGKRLLLAGGGSVLTHPALRYTIEFIAPMRRRKAMLAVRIPASQLFLLRSRSFVLIRILQRHREILRQKSIIVLVHGKCTSACGRNPHASLQNEQVSVPGYTE